MPTYQYACNNCGEQLEVVQKFTDDALTVCPACEGQLRKVYNAVGIVFKGSGFYRTDNRSSSSAAVAPAAKSDKPAATEKKSEPSSTGSSTSSSAA